MHAKRIALSVFDSHICVTPPPPTLAWAFIDHQVTMPEMEVTATSAHCTVRMSCRVLESREMDEPSDERI